MMDIDVESLSRRLAEAEAELVQWRAGEAANKHARDAARIVDEITGADNGTDPFAAAVRATRMPMVISNPRIPDNPIVFVNDAFCRLCGYPREEIVGRNCRFLQGPETAPDTVATIRAAVKAIEPVRIDILNYRKTGETFWNRLLMAPVRDAEGQLAYFFASQVDVTLERERLAGLESHNAALMAEVADRLHEQEDNAARFRFAADAGRLGIWEHDLRTGALACSAVCKENFGRGRNEVLTYADLENAVHPDDHALRKAALERSIATGAGFDVEYRIIVPDGAVRWVHKRAQVVRGPDGTALRMSGISLDVTARKAGESRRLALVELGDRIRDLDDPADLAFAAAEIMGRSLGVSRAGYGTVDLGAETITIERDWNAPGIRSLAGVLQFRDYGSYIEDLKRGALVTFADARLDPRTAATAAALEAISARAVLNLPVTETNGLVALLYLNDAAARDWTDDEITFLREVADRTQSAIQRRRAERDLRVLAVSLEEQVEERTRERDRLWEASEDLLAIAGYDGELYRISPSWVRRLGHDETTLLTTSYMDFVHPDDAALVAANIGKVRETGQSTRYENRFARADGSWCWIAWVLVPEPDERLINAVGRDVTAEKESAESQARLEQQLRQSQKMEAVGQLTGGLAHDFNNLLTGIAGSLDLLSKRVAQGRVNDLERYIIAALGASKRAAALTHRLLAFSRRQTLDPKPTDVHKLVNGMADLIRRTVGPEITVETVDMAGLWTTLVDQSQLENALLNLCINARDAMPDGGRIMIETANRWMDERTARERDLPPGQYLSLCVSDSGTGMPPDVIARAFDPFFTTKPLGQGTGLGLSMIYGFARQSGGQVRIYSEVGQGSMVCIYLPRHYGDGDIADDETGTGRELPRALDGETVLVVDDEPTVRMLVADVLFDLGYAAIECEDGPSGLKVLQGTGRVDLLITDVGLPGGMNGRQVADAARVLRPNLKVLFITGYAENAVIGNGHLDPGMAVLTKPFNMDDLASRIRSLIEG